MANVRVLVVDDSAVMRALFGDILDQAKGVEVVGTARNADEARDMIAELRPDVLTLDVEMPGMTGMEFLAELMETDPLPVIMLSGVTQEYSGTAQKALELGAVDCFPKPIHTSQEEFKEKINQLGGIVLAAASAEPGDSGSSHSGSGHNACEFEPDGRIVVLAAAVGSIDVVREVIAAYPANCPPTIILLDADTVAAERAVDGLFPSVACNIEIAETDALLVPGTVFLACENERHVVVENDYAPILSLVERDPIGGHRPSADMLLASIARAGLPAIGGLLAADHDDGVRGLKALAETGAQAFIQSSDEIGPNERFKAVRQLGIAADRVNAKDMGRWIVDTINKQPIPA